MIEIDRDTMKLSAQKEHDVHPLPNRGRLFQIAEDRIQKIDPKTGRVLATIPAPGGGGESGLAWAEGTLWVGQYWAGRSIKLIPREGRFFAPSSLQPLRYWILVG